MAIVSKSNGLPQDSAFEWFELAAKAYAVTQQRTLPNIWAVDLGMQCAMRPHAPRRADAGNACLWLSVFATYVQAVRRTPALLPLCAAGLRQQLTRCVNEAKQEKVIAKPFVPYESEPSNAVRRGALLLKDHVCDFMKSAEGMELYMEYVERDTRAAVALGHSEEEAGIFSYMEEVEKVRYGGMADHIYGDALTRVLQLQIVFLRWSVDARHYDGSRRHVVCRDGVDAIEELIIGYTGLPLLEEWLSWLLPLL